MENEDFSHWKTEVRLSILKMIDEELQSGYVEDMFMENCDYEYAAKQIILGLTGDKNVY